jgi:hypothetical protein
MANQYGYENLLTPDEVSKTVSIIDSLSDKWIQRSDGEYQYHTIGGVSHRDKIDNFHTLEEQVKYFNENNKILIDNFSYLYEIIINKVNKMFGRCEIVSDVPIPGFYIYGGYKKNDAPELSIYGDFGGNTNIHNDGLFPMLDYKWNQYGGATDSFGLTLALELPQNGAGILIWDQPDIGLYSSSEYANRCKRFDFNKNNSNTNVINKYIKNPIPEVIDYVPGSIFWQHGEVYHAAGYSIDTLNTDRRITMQIFGVKCNDIWRLVF